DRDLVAAEVGAEVRLIEPDDARRWSFTAHAAALTVTVPFDGDDGSVASPRWMSRRGQTMPPAVTCESVPLPTPAPSISDWVVVADVRSCDRVSATGIRQPRRPAQEKTTTYCVLRVFVH